MIFKSGLFRLRCGLGILCLVLFVFLLYEEKWMEKTHARISRRKLGAESDLSILSKSQNNVLKIIGSRRCLKRCLKDTHLVRNLNVNLDLFSVPAFENISAENPNVLSGGRYSPTTCRSHWNVAIIIPYRGRKLQLQGFLNHMLPIWQKQKLSFTVFVVQQAGDGLFNRAKLLNIGFKEANKYSKFDCFAFHDVDILSQNNGCLYSCPIDHFEVHHLSAYLDKYDYSLRKYGIRCPPSDYPHNEVQNFGGISIMTPDQFHYVNGFSNIFWGWGGEDDDMFLRVWRKGFKITRFADCKYSMYKHEQLGIRNNLKHHIHNSSFLRQDFEGLNSLSYILLSRQDFPLYTNITVDVGLPSTKMLELLKKHKLGREPCDGSVFLDKKEIW